MTKQALTRDDPIPGLTAAEAELSVDEFLLRRAVSLGASEEELRNNSGAIQMLDLIEALSSRTATR